MTYNNRPTVEIPRTRTKVEVVKAWTPIITAILALAGTVTIGILNSDDVGQSSIDSIKAQVENHLNTTVVPRVSEHINDMKEKIVRLEVMNDIFKDEINRLRDRLNKISSGRKMSPEAPRIMASPKPVKLEKREKLDIPRLDIQQQTLE